MPDAPRRVVVSGVGVLAAGGSGAAAFWAGLLTRPADEAVRRVGDVDLGRWLPKREARRLDRFAQLAIAAAGEALADAGLDDEATVGAAGFDPWRAGTVIGTGVGGAFAFEAAVRALDAQGERRVPLLTAPMVMCNAAAAAVSMRWGLRGPSEAVTTACAAGTHSIGAAARLVATGRCALVLAGGAEGCLTGSLVASFRNLGALTRTGISRPFDTARDGFCAAEGAAVVVLETLESALDRGATPYLEVLGAASTADAHHVTAPAPGGAGAVACMRLALDDAQLGPEAITHVNAHGTSTQLNDAAEAAALREVFGEHRPAVTSTKGVTGHPLGAAGAIEAVAVALSMRHRTIPPTWGLVDLDPAVDADVVTSARAWEPGPTLSNSFGFGGHNGSLVMAPVPA